MALKQGKDYYFLHSLVGNYPLELSRIMFKEERKNYDSEKFLIFIMGETLSLI